MKLAGRTAQGCHQSVRWSLWRIWNIKHIFSHFYSCGLQFHMCMSWCQNFWLALYIKKGDYIWHPQCRVDRKISNILQFCHGGYYISDILPSVLIKWSGLSWLWPNIWSFIYTTTEFVTSCFTEHKPWSPERKHLNRKKKLGIFSNRKNKTSPWREPICLRVARSRVRNKKKKGGSKIKHISKHLAYTSYTHD